MEQGDKKLSGAERLRITARAYGIISRYVPGLMQSIVVKALVDSLRPFPAIWFSAQILNGISRGTDIRKTAVLALAAVVINFALTAVKNRADIFHGEREAQMWCYFGKIFTDKQLSMDYADIEDAAVQKRKAREKENLFSFGNGLGQFVWTIRSTIEGIAGVMISLAMSAGIFTAAAGNKYADSPLWIAALAAAAAFGVFVNAETFKRSNDLFLGWIGKYARLNRIFVFFGLALCREAERAMDARIYGQHAPADAEMTKYIKTGKSERGYFLKTAAYDSAGTLADGIYQAVCYLFVIVKVYAGAVGIGGIVQYAGALGRLGGGLRQLVFGITDNTVYTRHLKSLFEYLDMPNKKYSGGLPVRKRAVGDGAHEIEFIGVSFKYPGTDTYALKNFNLNIRTGTRLAVVGMNGSGKTTMIKLLCRLYDPDEGVITLDGFDIREYRYDEYTDLFSVVFQDFKLFAFQLGQNVAARTDYDGRTAAESLSKSGFSARLADMPDGLGTPLYKDFDASGVEISGGEAQKIALARALYKNSPIIILDEPTAALDPLAEYEIYTRFNEIAGGKTTVYISHRLYSCRFCDDIAVFHEGGLVQRGTHAGLLSDKGGKYYELWSAQAQYYDFTFI